MQFNMKKLPPKMNRQQQGMTFIEVLIALVILVTGILGAVGMQATAKQGSFDAMQRSIASSLAQDIISRMRANAPTADADITLANYALSDYGSALNAEPDNRCDTEAGCTVASGNMITNDIYEWEVALMGADVLSGTNNAGGLVGAAACISQDGHAYTVVVSWQAKSTLTDNAAFECGAAGGNRRQVVVETFIYNI